jgi:predicted metal-dependent peptidase
MSALRRVSQARAELAWLHPFFAALALNCRLVEGVPGTTIKTMATDGVAIFFHPPFVDGLSDQELMGVLAHEVLHIANAHHLRRNGRNPLLWNIACDAAINPLLLAARFVLPTGGVLIEKYAGWNAEAIYDDLVKDMVVIEMPSWGLIMDQPGSNGGAMTATERQAAEARLRMDVIDAARNAEKAGRTHDFVKRLSEEARTTTINWREMLRHFVSKNGPVTSSSWRRLARRGIGVGISLPSPVREQCPPIGVIIDTSGSINQRALAAFLGELRAIVEEVEPEETNVGAGGTGLSVTFAMDPYMTFLELKGGGGTALQRMVTAFAEAYPQTRMLIVLTDLIDSRMNNEPQFPVMWLVWGENWRNRPQYWPTYGDIIPMGGDHDTG